MEYNPFYLARVANDGQELDDSVHRALVERIRELNEQKGWSANKLADFSDVGRGFLSDVLARRKSPSVRTLIKIAKALEVPVKDLFT